MPSHKVNTKHDLDDCGDIVTECCKAKEDSEIENTCSACKKLVENWVCSACGWNMNSHMLII